MKQETIVAIVLGSVLGIGVGLVILNSTSKGDKKPIQQAKVNTKDATISRPPDKTVQFEISEPTQDSTVTKNTVTIKGKAAKDALLVVQSPAGNKIQTLDKDEFSIDFPVAVGENIINISMYSKGTGSENQEKIMRIFYLSEE
jgi:hypothetical protein